MFLLYHAYVYLEFLVLACTIYILALTLVEPGVLFRLQADKETSLVLVDKRGFFYVKERRNDTKTYGKTPK